MDTKIGYVLVATYLTYDQSYASGYGASADTFTAYLALTASSVLFNIMVLALWFAWSSWFQGMQIESLSFFNFHIGLVFAIRIAMLLYQSYSFGFGWDDDFDPSNGTPSVFYVSLASMLFFNAILLPGYFMRRIQMCPCEVAMK